jgi:hypothetical protein
MLYNFYFKVILERSLHLKMLELCGPAPIGLKPSRSNRYLIPFTNTSEIRNTTFRPIFKICFWVFVAGAGIKHVTYRF